MADSIGIGRNSREEGASSRIYYPDAKPGEDVLQNKFAIKDGKVLAEIEGRIYAWRLQHGLPNRRISYAAYKENHAFLFGLLYDWAGKPREYTSGRGSAPFATPENIDREMLARFAKINAEDNLKGLNPDRFAERAAEHINEINAIHPFVEGNGRMQRVLLHEVAHQAGYKLAIPEAAKDRWNEASRIGFLKADYRLMRQLLRENLR